MFFVHDKIRRNVVVNTDHGSMIVNRFDCNHERVGHGQWLLDHGSASSVEAHECFQCIKDYQSPVIFDVGANIGTYATWLAKLFPKGKIYCFEPQRIVFQMLCGNMAINNFDNCFAYNMALGNQNGYLQIDEPNYNAPEDFGIFSLVEDKVFNKSGIQSTVPVMQIDIFIETYNIQKIDLLKIDVEGMDVDVLRGAKKAIKKFNPFIFIEHNDNRRSVLKEIQDELGNDYEFKVIQNNVLAKPI